MRRSRYELKQWNWPWPHLVIVFTEAGLVWSRPCAVGHWTGAWHLERP